MTLAIGDKVVKQADVSAVVKILPVYLGTDQKRSDDWRNKTPSHLCREMADGTVQLVANREHWRDE